MADPPSRPQAMIVDGTPNRGSSTGTTQHSTRPAACACWRTASGSESSVAVISSPDSAARCHGVPATSMAASLQASGLPADVATPSSPVKHTA